MGTLHYRLDTTKDNGMPVGNGITDLFIWRAEPKQHNDDVLHYYAARVPPEQITWETVEDISFMDLNRKPLTYPSHPIVEFDHKYSDGAELCIARAILALQEKGMNL
jgi:hypothetical protein